MKWRRSYQLAADMGGIGYITEFRADVARNNVLINAHMLEASRENQVSRYFFSSSACIYPMYRQESPDVTPLKEEDALPAEPEEGYGWEKLYAEKFCQYYQEEGKLLTAWLASTTSMVRSGRTRVGERRRRRPSAGSSRSPVMETRSRFGGRTADPVLHVRG